MAKRVFLSFIVEDRDHANGVRLLAKNPNNDLEFYDESVQEPFESTNAEYLRRKIKEKIEPPRLQWRLSCLSLSSSSEAAA